MKLMILFLLPLSMLSQEIPEDIKVSFKLGDANKLSIHLAEEVDVIIISDEGLYSKDMTTKKLGAFFKGRNIENFEVIHDGSSPSGAKYAICELMDGKTTFRIYLLLSAKSQKIIEIRIESDE